MTKTLVFTAFGGPETQQLVDHDVPAPGPSEVAIEVKAAGVNPADWKIRAGQMIVQRLETGGQAVGLDGDIQLGRFDIFRVQIKEFHIKRAVGSDAAHRCRKKGSTQVRVHLISHLESRSRHSLFGVFLEFWSFR